MMAPLALALSAVLMVPARASARDPEPLRSSTTPTTATGTAARTTPTRTWRSSVLPR
jgi:hypothetical protein